jgi:hypothetical protein
MRSNAGRAMTCLFLASVVALQAVHAQTRPSPVDEFVGWLDDPSRQWLATAQLQRFPDVAIPHLLEPQRAVLGPHGYLTPALLTLAKIGEPAIAPINERVRAILGNDDRYATQDAHTLIRVLGEIGPPAVPALVRFTDVDNRWIWSAALAAIVQMEPRSAHYGQVVSPWLLWRPADTRLVRLEAAIVPLLPRIEKVLDHAQTQQNPDTPSAVREAAYLLARWGGPVQRARGLRVLGDLARSSKEFYGSIDVIRDLYVLRAPDTAALIRLTAPRIPRGNDLRAGHLLGMAIALHRLGERDYGGLVDEAIRTGRPYDRIDTVTFLGQTEDLFNVPRLVAMLEDRTSWGSHVVGDVALEALRRLTLEDLPPDREAWASWWARHRDAEYGTVLERWITVARKSINDLPVWEANAWIGKLSTSRDPRILPLVADYLRRPDLNSSSIGPNRITSAGGGGPNGKQAPHVVALLLGLAQENVSGAIELLDACSSAADPSVRAFGAMALAAYRPRQAVQHLAADLESREAWQRTEIAELLLMLGDGRGIPAHIDALERGSAIFGEGMIHADGKTNEEMATDLSRGIRMFACRDLRVYTQTPLPCNPNATGDALAQQVDAWRAWWASSGAGFVLKSREARLDLELMYQIRPVTIDKDVER